MPDLTWQNIVAGIVAVGVVGALGYLAIWEHDQQAITALVALTPTGLMLGGTQLHRVTEAAPKAEPTPLRPLDPAA